MSKLVAAPPIAMPNYVASTDLWSRLPRNATGEAIISDELVDVFETLLLEGNTRSNCTRILGLQRTTLQDWLQKGREDLKAGRNTLHSRLLWAIDRGEGEQERRLARAATQAALSPVTEGAVALKLLERRNPDDWALAAPEPSPTNVVANLTGQALQAEARKVLQAAVSKKDEIVVEAEIVKKD